MHELKEKKVGQKVLVPRDGTRQREGGKRKSPIPKDRTWTTEGTSGVKQTHLVPDPLLAGAPGEKARVWGIGSVKVH